MIAATYLAAFVNSFIFIFLKAFQQLNVTKGHYMWVVPTSMMMALVEVWLVVKMAHLGWGWIVIPIGLGAGLGAVASMFVHNKLVHKDGKNYSKQEVDGRRPLENERGSS